MSNMSYCRFQNTLQDFNDCLGAVMEMVEYGQLDEGYDPDDDPNADCEGAPEPLSREERRAYEGLVRAAAALLDELPEDELERIGVSR